MSDLFQPLEMKICTLDMWSMEVTISSEVQYEHALAGLMGEEPYISLLKEDGTGTLFYKSNIRYIRITKTKDCNGQTDQKG